MNLAKFFNNAPTAQQTDFQIDIKLAWGLGLKDFSNWFAIEFYRKLLTDCYGRAAGIKDKDQAVYWDSVVSTQSARGLISLLATAMAEQKSRLYLVRVLDVVREADSSEQAAIDADPSGASGVCLNFDKFYQATVLKQLAALLFYVLKNSGTGLQLSQAVLIKISNLRENLANLNAQGPIMQARAVAAALKDEGRGVLMDAADAVEVPPYDPEPMERSLDVLFGLISMVTGMPQSYVNGIIHSGLSNTGTADELAVERGLLYYFNSIFKPVSDKLLNANITFKTSNWRKFAEVANLLPVLEATDVIPQEYKDKLIKELFG